MNCNKDNRKATAHKILLSLTLIKAKLSLTLEFATLSYRKYQNNTPC